MSYVPNAPDGEIDLAYETTDMPGETGSSGQTPIVVPQAFAEMVPRNTETVDIDDSGRSDPE